jgi:hypothetical protein
MSSFNKLLLIPEQDYMRKVQSLEKPAEIKEAAKADYDLSALLSDTRIPDDLKVKIYAEVLQRFLLLGRPQIPQATALAASAPVPRGEEEEEEPLTVDQIVGVMPQRLATKTKKLLDHLKQKEAKLDWTPSGEVLIEGDPIPQSNVMELLRYAVGKNARRGQQPSGWNEFVKLLNDVKVPQQFVARPTKYVGSPATPETGWISVEPKHTRRKL